MSHYYEKNIVEIKNIYTTYLVNIISPLIYEGFKSLYENANRIDHKVQNAEKTNPNVSNLGIIKIFQLCLKEIPQWNMHLIDTETKRIKEQCKCSEWFDDLLKAVVKSHIVLLTYNANAKTCDIVNNKLHETVDTNFFIHNCYIECAKIFFNYPEIFYHNFSALEIKRNQRESIDIIKKAIEESLKNMLPIKTILQEYLSNDYIREDKNIENELNNLKYMVHNDLNGNINKFDGDENKFDGDENNFDGDENNFDGDNKYPKLSKSLLVIDSTKNISSDAHINNANNEISNKLDEVEKIINDDKPNTHEEMQQKLNEPMYISSPKSVKTKKAANLFNNVRVKLVPHDEEHKSENQEKIKLNDKQNNDEDQFNVHIIDKINNVNDAFFDDLLDVNA